MIFRFSISATCGYFSPALQFDFCADRNIVIPFHGVSAVYDMPMKPLPVFQFFIIICNKDAL